MKRAMHEALHSLIICREEISVSSCTVFEGRDVADQAAAMVVDCARISSLEDHHAVVCPASDELLEITFYFFV
jgi:hypothetical protein